MFQHHLGGGGVYQWGLVHWRGRWYTRELGIPGGIPEAEEGYMGVGILRGPVY